MLRLNEHDRQWIVFKNALHGTNDDYHDLHADEPAGFTGHVGYYNSEFNAELSLLCNAQSSFGNVWYSSSNTPTELGPAIFGGDLQTYDEAGFGVGSGSADDLFLEINLPSVDQTESACPLVPSDAEFTMDSVDDYQNVYTFCHQPNGQPIETHIHIIICINHNPPPSPPPPSPPPPSPPPPSPPPPKAPWDSGIMRRFFV